MNRIKTRLRTVMNEQRISCSDLNRITGIDRKTIKDYIDNGVPVSPSFEKMNLLAKACDTNIKDLLDIVDYNFDVISEDSRFIETMKQILVLSEQEVWFRPRKLRHLTYLFTERDLYLFIDRAYGNPYFADQKEYSSFSEAISFEEFSSFEITNMREWLDESFNLKIGKVLFSETGEKVFEITRDNCFGNNYQLFFITEGKYKSLIAKDNFDNNEILTLMWNEDDCMDNDITFLIEQLMKLYSNPKDSKLFTFYGDKEYEWSNNDILIILAQKILEDNNSNSTKTIEFFSEQLSNNHSDDWEKALYSDFS